MIRTEVTELGKKLTQGNDKVKLVFLERLINQTTPRQYRSRKKVTESIEEMEDRYKYLKAHERKL